VLLPVARVLGLCATLALSGCQCNLVEDNVNQLKDAGFTEDDAGPPPPIFPLKDGDELRFSIGGRIPECPDEQQEGDCERNIAATYIVRGTHLEAGRWTIDADFYYEGLKEKISATAISQLVLSNAAPFAQISIATPVSSDDDPASFDSDGVPTHEMTALEFPFFQFVDGDPAIFEATGAAFCDAWTATDPEAECNFLSGDARMEAVFVDALAENKLHMLRVEYHPMGFVCSWIEELGDFGADPTRDSSTFDGFDGNPEAFFFSPVRLTRGGVAYRCSCFGGLCIDSNDPTKCLDPSDPDAIIDCP
jgi:hypothetical protein